MKAKSVRFIEKHLNLLFLMLPLAPIAMVIPPMVTKSVDYVVFGLFAAFSIIITFFFFYDALSSMVSNYNRNAWYKCVAIARKLHTEKVVGSWYYDDPNMHVDIFLDANGMASITVFDKHSNLNQKLFCAYFIEGGVLSFAENFKYLSFTNTYDNSVIVRRKGDTLFIKRDFHNPLAFKWHDCAVNLSQACSY